MSLRASYKDALKSLSTKTGAPLGSLVVSFAVLHEITAVVPLIGIFYASRSLGVGERFVATLVDSGPPSEGGFIREKCRLWVHEGEEWAGKVGRRYGIFGFPQTPKGTKFEREALEQTSNRIAGDVANAVLAYGATKVNHHPVLSEQYRTHASARLLCQFVSVFLSFLLQHSPEVF
jgi:hypothetical protein